MLGLRVCASKIAVAGRPQLRAASTGHKRGEVVRSPFLVRKILQGVRHLVAPLGSAIDQIPLWQACRVERKQELGRDVDPHC